MRSFKQFIYEQNEQFTYGDMTTDNFDICPSALAAFKDNAEDSDFDSEEDFVAAINAVDRYLGLEKKLKAQGSANEDDVATMKDLVSRAIEAIANAGLSNHDYHQVHLDAVEDLAE
jgi:hypothetical protein